MKNINPKKLLNSKWTAVSPVNKEKHFIITDVEFDEEGLVVATSIEAVLPKRAMAIDCNALKDDSQWVYGWK